jgi:tRNA(Ile)-lysidine synthase
MRGRWRGWRRGCGAFEFGRFADLPAEVGLRLLGRAIAYTGSEGPVELGKLEALYAAVRKAAPHRVRRTLAGAQVTLAAGRLTVERAPARRTAGMPQNRKIGFAK